MKVQSPGAVLGIVGGGQLGKMIAMAAAQMGLQVHILTDKKDSPASFVANKTIVARYSDKKALERFVKPLDIVTYEFENIPLKTMEYIAKTVPVHPGLKSLEIAQHRIREKDFINQLGIKTAPYRKITTIRSLQKAYREIGPKCILKTTEFGYDGKGQHIIDENTNLTKLWNKLKWKEAILEKFIPFKKELSVIICRCHDGSAMPYMPSENIHENGILDTSMAPAAISEELIDHIWDVGFKIADALELVGVIAIEFFVSEEDELLVNELAPRPHNSGHWTMDACITSQFEQLVRAVCGWPLGSTHYHSRAIMKNLIGEDVHLWQEFIKDPDMRIHIYGKKEAVAGRKMGHVTHLLGDEDHIVTN